MLICSHTCMCACSMPTLPHTHMHTHIQHAVQAVKVIVREKGYVQPPPTGCPLEMYRLMVKCW